MEQIERLREAMETLKHYCRDHDDCGACVFHDDISDSQWYACLLRRQSPTNWNTDKVHRLCLCSEGCRQL